MNIIKSVQKDDIDRGKPTRNCWFFLHNWSIWVTTITGHRRKCDKCGLEQTK